MNPVQRNILDVALAEFANFGLEGTRIDTIAAGTHTSKRMIYYHFGSKEGLYTAVLEYAYRSVREGEDLEPLKTLPPMQALVRYISYAFNSFSRHPDFIRLSQQETLQGGRFLKNLPSVQEMNRASLAMLDSIVRRGQADGSMRSDVDPLHVYINYIGLCHYHISSRHNYSLQFDFDPTQPDNQAARLASITDMIVRYVRA
jgi:AcrR family transcriptional regulator|nr:TetR/AcrR family transcriptional regulator [uncultured Limnohabitans sp.]